MMKDAYTVSSIARQIGKVAEKLDSLATGVQYAEQNASDVSEVYENLLLGEVEHLQILTLELTRRVSGAEMDAASEGEDNSGIWGDDPK